MRKALLRPHCCTVLLSHPPPPLTQDPRTLQHTARIFTLTLNIILNNIIHRPRLGWAPPVQQTTGSSYSWMSTGRRRPQPPPFRPTSPTTRPTPPRSTTTTNRAENGTGCRHTAWLSAPTAWPRRRRCGGGTARVGRSVMRAVCTSSCTASDVRPAGGGTSPAQGIETPRSRRLKRRNRVVWYTQMLYKKIKKNLKLCMIKCFLSEIMQFKSVSCLISLKGVTCKLN